MLAASVTVAGGLDEWAHFMECLRKWLVAMVAGWIDDRVVNHEVLVFIGRQGIYKTTWMNALQPPELRSYFTTQAGVGDNPKDEELAEQAFIDLGFEPVECDGLTGYLAVQRAPEEVSMLGRQLATRARRDEEPPDHF